MIRSHHLSVLLALLAIPVAACSMGRSDDDGIAASGTGSERSYAVTDFTSIGLGGAGDVEVRVGPAFSVKAIGTPTALDKIKVERDGKSLNLSRRKGFTWGGGDKVRFLVTMPRIEGADIGGSGTIVVDRVEGPSFNGNIGGSGRLDIRGLKVDKAEFGIGGSGDIAAAGTAKSVKASIAGSGNIDGGKLTASSANVSIAGSGSVKLDVNGDAKVSIVGSGDVDVGANAKCSVSKMGSGDVRCGS